MKRLALFICTLLCANVLLAQVGTTFWIGDIQYQIKSIYPAKAVKVYDADPSITTANMPETVTYNGTTYSVTAIGDEAFKNCSSLTSVTIPNSVTSIGKMAFSYCSSLTSVTIPNSVTTSIGGGVFYNCSSLTSVTLSNNITNLPCYYDGSDAYGFFYNCSSLTSVTIPNSVTLIGNYAFSGCRSLTSITIPNSVTSIASYAFSGCSSLTSITIPNSVTSIGGCAFGNCSSLTSITIPNSVTSIGENAFYGCISLTSMTVEMNNIPNLGNIGLYSTLQNLTLGENVTSIRSGAFNGYSFLQNITCLATTPPTLADNTVFPYPNIASLKVPCGTLEAYSAPTSYWNVFFSGRIEEDCSGLEDAEFADLSIYPNPTRGKVTFSQAIEKVEVIDLSGKTLQTYENANEINIEALPAGVYHLRMTIEDKTTTRKVIKE